MPTSEQLLESTIKDYDQWVQSHVRLSLQSYLDQGWAIRSARVAEWEEAFFFTLKRQDQVDFVKITY